jgi:hypothetical protein
VMIPAIDLIAAVDGIPIEITYVLAYVCVI